MRKGLISFALALSLAGAACGSRPAEVAVAGDSAIVASLLDVKAAKDVPCDAGQIPASTCQALAKALVPLWDAYLAVNAAITAEAPVTEIDALVSQLKQAGVAFKDVAAEVQGNYKQLILDAVEAAIRRFDSR